jgi:hypothetical protein
MGTQRRPTFGRRMRNTYLTWLLLGAFVGAAGGLGTSSASAIISGSIGGMIVLPIVGLAIGVLGGDTKGTFVGAAGGLLGCWLSSRYTGHPIQPLALQLSVVFGALAGATFSLYLMMKIWTYTSIYRMARTLLLGGPAQPVGQLGRKYLFGAVHWQSSGYPGIRPRGPRWLQSVNVAKGARHGSLDEQG